MPVLAIGGAVVTSSYALSPATITTDMRDSSSTIQTRTVTQYDALGRVRFVTSDVGSSTATRETQYDQLGRVSW